MGEKSFNHSTHTAHSRFGNGVWIQNNLTIISIHNESFPSRFEQGLWKHHGRPRGRADASELLPAAPAGPHRSLQPPWTQPHQCEHIINQSHYKQWVTPPWLGFQRNLCFVFQWTDGLPPVQFQPQNGPTTSLGSLLWELDATVTEKMRDRAAAADKTVKENWGVWK